MFRLSTQNARRYELLTNELVARVALLQHDQSCGRIGLAELRRQKAALQDDYADAVMDLYETPARV